MRIRVTVLVDVDILDTHAAKLAKAGVPPLEIVRDHLEQVVLRRIDGFGDPVVAMIAPVADDWLVFCRDLSAEVWADLWADTEDETQ